MNGKGQGRGRVFTKPYWEWGVGEFTRGRKTAWRGLSLIASGSCRFSAGAEIGVGITMFRFFLAFFDEIQWTQEYVPCAYTFSLQSTCLLEILPSCSAGLDAFCLLVKTIFAFPLYCSRYSKTPLPIRPPFLSVPSLTNTPCFATHLELYVISWLRLDHSCHIAGSLPIIKVNLCIFFPPFQPVLVPWLEIIKHPNPNSLRWSEIHEIFIFF